MEKNQRLRRKNVIKFLHSAVHVSKIISISDGSGSSGAEMNVIDPPMVVIATVIKVPK